MSAGKHFGLSVALATPFLADGAIDVVRLADHAKWCLKHGCTSVTVFGTTGEGASVSSTERISAFAGLLAAGIPAARLIGGVSAAAIGDAVIQCRLALDVGCRALLLPPPYYFKSVSDDGVYAWYAQVFDDLGPSARDVILYNIPSVTQVALSVDLIGRLKTAFPKIVTGVKDSSGDWPYAERLLATHKDLSILLGDERLLARAARLGGAGAISGIANLVPARLLGPIEQGTENPQVTDLVNAVLDHPVTTAIKTLLAHRHHDLAWRKMRPPLDPLSPQADTALINRHDRIFAADRP